MIIKVTMGSCLGGGMLAMCILLAEMLREVD